MHELTTREVHQESRAIPDVLLAAQLTRRDSALPERALVASVLLDGIECFLRYHGAPCGQGRRLFDDAKQWLFGPDDSSPLSFEEACELLSLDVERVRMGLRQLSARRRIRR